MQFDFSCKYVWTTKLVMHKLQRAPTKLKCNETNLYPSSRNIAVEDKRPTLQHFMVAMEGVEPWSDPGDKRDPGDLFGILFQESIHE